MHRYPLRVLQKDVEAGIEAHREPLDVSAWD